MKKYVALLLALFVLLGVLAGCGAQVAPEKPEASGKIENTAAPLQSDSPAQSEAPEKLRIVATIFPEYDWVLQILGDNSENADVTLLLDSGVDLHSYQPTAEDILKISGCDLLIYVGGESDGWIDDAIAASANKDMKVINLLKVLGDVVKTEEAVEGMQTDDHDHDHDHDHDDHNDHDGHDDDHDVHDDDHDDTHEHKHEDEKDEHVWLSLKNAKTLVAAISKVLQELAPENKESFEANTAAYIEKLSALDDEYKKTVDSAAQKTVVFGDRFPFRYLVDDYGIRYYAAFLGCSAETEASFETVLFLAKKVDELKLPCVLTIEGTQHKIAETIVQNTAEKTQKVLVMDSLQSTTTKEAASGTSYLSVMEQNLTVLKEALG